MISAIEKYIRPAALLAALIVALASFAPGGDATGRVMAQIPPQPPAPTWLGTPANLSANPDNIPGAVSLTWAPAVNATVHWVWSVKVDNTGGKWTLGGSNSATVEGLVPGQDYLFAVIAGRARTGVNRYEWSQWSNWVQSTDTPVQTIIFGDLNWPSALLQNRIAQYIVEKGYGYPTDVKFGSTLTLFQGLKNGDTHVAMEIWLPNQDEAWNEARDEGEVVSLGQSLGKDWQSAFVIPAYLQKQYPDLDSVADLKNPKYRRLFATPETGGKARLVSCVIGWACETVNAAQVEGYGLSDHVEIVNPGDGAAMNADLYGAYVRQEPWLGYQ